MGGFTQVDVFTYGGHHAENRRLSILASLSAVF